MAEELKKTKAPVRAACSEQVLDHLSAASLFIRINDTAMFFADQFFNAVIGTTNTPSGR